MKNPFSIIIIVIVAVVCIGLYASAYIVDEKEQVVITQFGKIIGEPITTPGLKFKLPDPIQTANFFPKNLQMWDGDPGQIPTLDKTYIWVDTFATWIIKDPIKFFETVNNPISALGRLDDIIDPAVRNAVTSYPLIESVRMTNRELDTFDVFVTGLKDKEDNDKDNKIDLDHKRRSFKIEVGRKEITKGIMTQAKPKLEKFGIELVDVKIKRINYVREVRKTVYDRMIAERKQIAEKFRSEGQGEARKILGEKERDLKKITSEAYKTAQEIKGVADATSTKIFAKAYGKDPAFYSFVKTLEIYGETLGEKSSVVLSTDSEFLKYLRGYSGTN